MTTLLSYKSMGVRFFGDSWEYNYVLTLQETKKFLWCMKTYLIEKNFTISMFQDIKQHTDHWDELIKTKANIKL